jgi:hypothetical protein
MDSQVIQTCAELIEKLNALEKIGCVPWLEFTNDAELREFGAWRCCRETSESYPDRFYVAVGFPHKDNPGHFPCALVIHDEVWWAI